MHTKEQLRALVDPAGFGLEIGPSHAPLFPKRDGWRVEVLDHLSQADLRAKFAHEPVDLDAIEAVDWVWDGRPIHEVIPHGARYDFIFSSHVIEHVVDFLGYLQSCEILLKPGGVSVLAVPDKRYTFDVLRPASTTGEVLQAHHTGRARHRPATAYDFIADFARLDGREVWAAHDRGALDLRFPLQDAKDLFDDAKRPDAPYHDLHGWVFTPASFRLILHDLRALGLTRLGVRWLEEVGTLEFRVVLARDETPVDPAERLSLLKAAVREGVISGLQLLAAEDERMAAALAGLGS